MYPQDQRNLQKEVRSDELKLSDIVQEILNRWSEQVISQNWESRKL